MEISRVGVDLAKNVFQLHGADRKGKIVWKRQTSRDKWLKILFATVKPDTVIGMEACTGAPLLRVRPTTFVGELEWLVKQ